MFTIEDLNLSTIVIYDTEFTAWPGSMERKWSGENEHREIVQIGAIKIGKNSDFAEKDTFERLVRPLKNPILSEYFIELTGITQGNIDEFGIDFPSMYSEFDTFCNDAEIVISNGVDHLHLQENCSLNEIQMSNRNFFNVAPLISKALGEPKQVVSGTLGERFGFESSGPIHTALADARCIANALKEIFARETTS